VDAMTSEKTASRRRYGRDFKAQVMAECDVPGASVAKVAMTHGINTNVVHSWRKSAREAGALAISQQREFVPIQLGAPAVQPATERGIEVELRRGAVTMKITWPPSASADFAAWTRELLR
jgi:transposase